METAKSILRIILGILMLIIGIYLIVQWSKEIWMVIKASFALLVLLVGFAFMVIGFSDMRKN